MQKTAALRIIENNIAENLVGYNLHPNAIPLRTTPDTGPFADTISKNTNQSCTPLAAW